VPFDSAATRLRSERTAVDFRRVERPASGRSNEPSWSAAKGWITP